MAGLSNKRETKPSDDTVNKKPLAVIDLDTFVDLIR